MHANARAFTHCIQTIDYNALVASVLRHYLAVDIGRNTAHLVMDSGHHRNRFFGDVDVGKVVTNFEYRRQALHDGLNAQVGHIEVDVVFVRTAAAAFFDLLVHAARHVIARCQIFVSRCVTFHETLAQAIAQNRAFASAAFGQQHARTGYACGMELPELHVFQRNASARCHAQTVTRIDKRIGRRCKDATCTTGSEHRGFGFQDVELACFHF